MERNISEEEREKILNLGAFEYSCEMCANVLEWPEDEIAKYLENVNCEFYRIYNTGRIRAQYVIDLKLFQQAQAGDIKSLEKLQSRKRMRK